MSRLILHRAIASPPARAVTMLADILGIDIDIRDVNLIKFEHKTPEFKKLNPMGTVPVLQDGDFVLSESHAIMLYLLDKYGGDHKERLYPSEVRARALVDQSLYFDAGVFFNAFREAGFSIFYGGLTEPTPQNRERIDSAYEVIDTYLQTRRYIAADTLTLADLSVGSTATAVQALYTLDKDKYPRCHDWMTRLEQEPFFKTINREGVIYFTKLIEFLSKRNKSAAA